MLRGLIFRQIFFVVDLVLMGVIGLAAILALKTFLEGEPVLIPTQVGAQSADDVLDVAALEERAAYNPIIQNKLFGVAGERSTDASQEPPPVEDVVKAPPTLPLELLGTTGVSPKDPRSNAIIMNARPRDPKDRVATYFVGQVILDQISLFEVHKRSVILWNEANRQKIELAMDEEQVVPNRGGPSTLASRQRSAPSQPQTPGVYNLNRDELVDDVMNASTDLASMNPRIAYDDDGNAIGITADGLQKLELAQKLGFEEGDVVQQINGRTVDSMDKVYEILQQFQGLNTVRVSVLRNGSPTMLTYNLR